ncbi:MAG: multidrug resistance protein [Armatimonadetes bacterium]|nr:multidrug resistance protein [Armatimonadota bacterium]
MTLAMFGTLLIALALGTAGNTFMKMGLNRHGQIESIASLFGALMQLRIIIGLGFFVVSSMLYLTVMSKMPLSVLYPMVALNYIFVTISARYFLGEPVNAMRVVGLSVIVAGVVLVGLSQQSKPAGNGTAMPQVGEHV